MKKYLIPALISFTLTVIGIVGVYYFVPLGFIENPLSISQPIGTTITTINGSDTLSSSRTTINNNFTALNAGKIEVSSSSVASITTLSNLVTVGTLTSGALGSGFTIIGVGQGGTGSSTLSLNQVLLGNSASGIKVVAGYGTSGQLLTSNGAGNAPYWASPSVDTSIAYDWTGEHSWTASTTLFKLEISDDGFATSSITAANLDILTKGTASDASSLHFHSGNCVNGMDYLVHNVTGNQVIAHGLGVAPTSIVFDAHTNAGGAFSISHGYATSTSASNAMWTSGTGTTAAEGQSTSSAIYLPTTTGQIYAAAAVSGITSTTFTLNWTTNLNVAATRFFTWTACK